MQCLYCAVFAFCSAPGGNMLASNAAAKQSLALCNLYATHAACSILTAVRCSNATIFSIGKLVSGMTRHAWAPAVLT